MFTLLATASFWCKNLDKIPSNKTIRLLFQPAEEGPGGAKPMIEERCLDGVDEVYGFHNMPIGPEGSISIRSPEMMAGSNRFIIKIKGKGGCGAEPAEANDPITCGFQVYNSLQTIKSRSLMNTDKLAMSV